MLLLFSKTAGGTRVSYSLNEELLKDMKRNLVPVSQATGESCSKLLDDLMAKYWPLMRSELQDRLNQSQG